MLGARRRRRTRRQYLSFDEPGTVAGEYRCNRLDPGLGGSSHACALKNDGRIFCWGANSRGQLGNNSSSASLVPVQEYTAATDWAQVSAGSVHTCALKQDGRLFCWGRGYQGQLGNNVTYDSKSGSLVPVQEYTAATDWALVEAGSNHTCALKQDGRLFCWGANSSGQLGNNSTSNSLVPVQEYTAATDWAQVSAGNSYTCALKQDGRLFCWGANSSGQLGNNSTSSSLLPVQENTSATDWAQVQAGSSHTCAVKRDGRLFCWGHGPSGELGNNSTSDSLVPVQENTGATDWAQVSAGGGHTCAVKTDGRLFCWGSSEYGQLGNNSTSNNLVPVQEYTAAADWAQVEAGSDYTCAVTRHGRLFLLGSNRNTSSADQISVRFGRRIRLRKYAVIIPYELFHFYPISFLLGCCPATPCRVLRAGRPFALRSYEMGCMDMIDIPLADVSSNSNSGCSSAVSLRSMAANLQMVARPRGDELRRDERSFKRLARRA